MRKFLMKNNNRKSQSLLIETLKVRKSEKDVKITREVVKEGNGGWTADDGVKPDPPTGAEDSAGDAGAENCP